ncbi:hypothetical protein VNO78_07590 [Psophocarpus tetragonolobus]|uniref:Uncharacterized protein n=1 Tax=Psophocarpus tetragonolobus TaxID=3891 RepID=A0AAN9T3I1_PSOTE
MCAMMTTIRGGTDGSNGGVVSNGSMEEGSDIATIDVILEESELKCVDSENGEGFVWNNTVGTEIHDGQEDDDGSIEKGELGLPVMELG